MKILVIKIDGIYFVITIRISWGFSFYYSLINLYKGVYLFWYEMHVEVFMFDFGYYYY